MSVVTAVSFGGGVNSTALLLGLADRGENPGFIMFADTGSEFPETYEYVRTVSHYLMKLGFPGIDIVHRGYARHASLEDECRNLTTLPSIAFGYRGCSVKWKRQPMDRFLKQNPVGKGILARGDRIERLIGIDYGEQHRGKIPDDKFFTYRFPLIEWKWGREECVDVIRRHGLEVPRKSACFFCPAMKKSEVLALASERPDLFERAVAMERHAKTNPVPTTIKGLGRHWSWEELVKSANHEALTEITAMDCLCFEGAAQ